MKAYKTVHGDTWDIISLKVYGNSNLSYKLIEANPQYSNYIILGGGIELNIPEVSETSPSTLPPWKVTA